MRTRWKSILVVVGFALCDRAMAMSDNNGLWIDPAHDARIRHTDSGSNGVLPPSFEPIDLLRVECTGWSTPTPQTDPYNGYEDENADLMRIKIVFAGVVSPPGPLGIGEAGGQFDPLRYGNRPVYGAIELDIDDQKNSGGELGDLARLRYLANVGRFGKTPPGSIAERVAIGGDDFDGNFWAGRQFERSGAEFAFVMCGCWVPTIMSEGVGANGVFDSGETWIVHGRFFERVQSFASLSGLFGGSQFGLFDKTVDVRWSHDEDKDETAIELVYPLTMAGAAMLTGEPEQQINLSLFDHTSIAEAVCDIIESAEFASGPVEELIDQWRNEDFEDFLEPVAWRVTALVGTAYTVQEPDARFVWTDTGFDEQLGDIGGDGAANEFDTTEVLAFITAEDGGLNDCDGTTDGAVAICDVAENFSIFDFNNDGVVDSCDASTLGRGANLNQDHALDFFDVALFLTWFSAQDPRADFTGEGQLTFFDVLAFLQTFSTGCH